MALIDAAVRAVIAETKLAYVATVCPDGTPNLSPKATVQAWDDSHVIFADIASPTTIRNLRHNPAIEINMVSPFARRGFRIKGTAVVKHAGPEFDAAKEALHSRHGTRYPINGVVVVTVETVRPVLSPTYQFDPDAKEAAVRAEWMAIYGVKPAEPG
jgi:predicted pyridoxine 5'-phosphate oxidase superfamily flavin-nucleotide-binding protein